MQPGSNEGQLGALRAVVFGEHRLIEQLTAFDDSEHHVYALFLFTRQLALLHFPQATASWTALGVLPAIAHSHLA